jgi:hypothetical protein
MRARGQSGARDRDEEAEVTDVRDARPEDRDAIFELILRTGPPTIEWIACAADDPVTARRILIDWNIDAALVAGGILVVDDLSACVYWTGRYRGAVNKLPLEFQRTGDDLYPPLPVACQQRIFDLGQMTRMNRWTNGLHRAIRLSGLDGSPRELQLRQLIEAFLLRLPKNRQCVTTKSGPVDAAGLLHDFGFRLDRDLPADGDRPAIETWRRPPTRFSF